MNRRMLLGTCAAALAALLVPVAAVASEPMDAGFWRLSDSERGAIYKRAFCDLTPADILTPEFLAFLNAKGTRSGAIRATAYGLAMVQWAIPDLGAHFVEKGELRADFDATPHMRRAMRQAGAR